MPIPGPVKEARKNREAGKLTEALTLLNTFLEDSESVPCGERIIGLNEQSQCYWRLGNLVKAEHSATESLRLAKQAPFDQPGEADALNNLGVIYWQRGELDRSEEFFQQSLLQRERLGDPQDLSASLNNLGMIYRQRGKLELAENYYQRSLSLREQIGNLQDIAASLNNLGVLYSQRGKLLLSEEYYQRSLTIFKQLGNLQDIAVSFHNLGIIYRQRGELDQAEEYHQHSLALYKKIGNSERIATIQNDLGVVFLQKGKLNQAEDVFQQALVLNEQLGHPQHIAESRHHLVRVILMHGHIDSVIENVDHLAELSKNYVERDITVRYYLATGRLSLVHRDLGKALEYGQKAKSQAEQIPHFELVVESTQFLLEVLLQVYLLREEDEYMTKCEILLSAMEEICKREYLHGAYIESIFIQGLLKRAKFDLQGATLLFQRTELLAEECGIQLVVQKAQEELKKIQQQISKLKELQQKSVQVFEHEQLKDVLAYIQQVRKFS